MVVADASLEAGRAARRFDPADESGRGERVEGLVHGLYGDVADPVAHTGGESLGTEVVPVPDRLQERDASGRHPQSDAAQVLGGVR
ncbi:hypothetical protein GCM10023220_29850 [Streptomyces ziwulingensis]|uniref:Uncharacterized protein n=1 Tax=Streptomyces ziwulingensis TaxID=1045501 RepID=A0ABP9BS15_9ACTN